MAKKTYRFEGHGGIPRTWNRSPSGRLHWGNSCSSGLTPGNAKKAHPSDAELEELLDEPGRPRICRCAWSKAEQVISRRESFQ